MRTKGEAPIEPAGLDVTPRKIDLAISPDTPRYWFDGHPFKSHYFNALSSTFPVGERFFVRSVRHYLDDIDNESLKQKVSNFVSQEGRHSIEHDAHIELLAAQGYQGIRRFEQIDRAILGFLNRHFPRFALAATISLEHFTAILANELLEYPERWTAPMHEDMRLLWQWHAIEETEHKAVAFDVYQEIGGSYGLRVTAMVVETIGLLLDVLARTGYLLWKDGLFWKPHVWWQGVRFVWGKHGALRSIISNYFKFYRRDFHPWQDNNYHLVKEFVTTHQGDFK